MSMQLSVFTRYAIRSLAANRTRTVVTAVGVTLACALLTAVLVLAGSLRAGLVAGEKSAEGAWQVEFSRVSEAQVALIEDELPGTLAVRRDLGAALTGDAEVPLLNVVARAGDEKGLVTGTSLASGRWPEAPGEVAVPSHWEETWPVGSTVELSLGRRWSHDGYVCTHENGPDYALDEKGEARLAETLEDVGAPRTLTVVGLVDGAADVAYVCPEEPAAGPEPICYVWAAPGLAEAELGQMAEGICEQGGSYLTHDLLLEYEGLSENHSLDLSLGLVLLAASGVVCLVAAVLVSGAFRVSVAERVRQFGLLSSAGASRRQLVRVVLAEAVLLCAVGIPAGLALGVALDAVALPIAAEGTAWMTGGLPASLCVEPAALLVATGVTAAAVLLSALAPALRASRLPAIEAMRDGEFVGVRRRRVGPPRVLQARPLRRSCPSAGPTRLRRTTGGCDLPVLLARRFERAGRVRSGATVAMLALSVALLVGGGVFGSYYGSVSVFEGGSADVSAYVSAEGVANAPGSERELAYLPALLERLRGVPGIEGAGFVSRTQVSLDLDETAVAPWADEELWRPDGHVFGTVYYVDDVTWERLSAEVGAAPGDGCVIVNEVLDAVRAGERPFSEALLGTRVAQVDAGVSWEVVGLLDEVPDWFWLSRGDLVGVLPTVLAPASSVAGLGPELVGYGMTTLYATAEDSAAAAADVERLIGQDPTLAAWDGVVDERARACRMEALYAAIGAFFSVFGVIAAAVGVASAFNAAAASVLLRAHDLAVLRSVGMGERDLRRMLAHECARVAARGLAAGVALALALDGALYATGSLARSSVVFAVPWAHLAGAAALVALVLLASCAYALRRLRATPLLDALRVP